jgi:peptide-methionine (S)-S-oxide reductase
MGNETRSIVLGGGCFWCTEAVFELFEGIIKINPGYAGGRTKNPTYKEVCNGTTGHAEVIKLEYLPNIISLKTILEIFFKAHDPTSVNKQGADVGSQYRSIILYEEEEDRKVIEDYIKGIAGDFDKPIATEVKKLDEFYPSEDYHKDYYKLNPLQPYCMFVIRPKIAKIKKEFNLKNKTI